jgi:hypothetical protein
VAPQVRLNGDYRSDCTGIVHEVDWGDVVTLQSVRSVEYVTLSLSLKNTLNPVMGEPPESGKLQLTITLSGIQVVIGG